MIPIRVKWFLFGVVTTVIVNLVRIVHRFLIYKNKPCTSCGRNATRRVVETFDFATHRRHRGVLCDACAHYSDRIAPPPWA